MMLATSVILITVGILAIPASRIFRRRVSRTKRLPPPTEHVLILGASSGVGRELALQYAARGARLCIVARGKQALSQVRWECDQLAKNESTIAVVADFTDAQAMVALRARLEREWGALDTILVVAGVSALRPLLETAGVRRQGKSFQPLDAGIEGVEQAIAISDAAVRANYTGPLVAAVTFIPFLTRSSHSPSILLLSSAAAVIPPPTRTLYGSTKGASLLLYQALSVEHPEITFSFILPGTIEGDFRASAVDGGPVREADPNKAGLSRNFVAQRCIQAIDREERTVFLSDVYRWGHLLYWIYPKLIEKKAREKYRFSIP